MAQTNLYRALLELLPEDPLQVATVAMVHTAEGLVAILGVSTRCKWPPWRPACRPSSGPA